MDNLDLSTPQGTLASLLQALQMPKPLAQAPISVPGTLPGLPGGPQVGATPQVPQQQPQISAPQGDQAPPAQGGGGFKDILRQLLVGGLKATNEGIQKYNDPRGWEAAREAKATRDKEAWEDSRLQAQQKQQHDEFTARMN